MSEKYKDKEWLERKLKDEKKTCVDIAEELDVGQTTIREWVHRYNIEMENLNKWRGTRNRTLQELKEKGVL